MINALGLTPRRMLSEAVLDVLAQRVGSNTKVVKLVWKPLYFPRLSLAVERPPHFEGVAAALKHRST